MAAIGETEAKEILSCEESRGRSRLAQLMNLGPYGEERNMQKAILADLYYDHLKFAAERGFPWEQVCGIVQFAEEFISTATDQTITEAVQLYQAQSANLLLELGERNYRVYTSFLFSTFFTHFHLYKYVLANQRRQNIPQLTADVQPPMPPLPLPQAQEVGVWDYERRLEQLDDQEKEALRQRTERQEKEKLDVVTRRAAAKGKVDTIETPFTKESLAEMVRSVLSEYAQATGAVISSSIQGVEQELAIRLQKTSLPRPAVLGPPPRYKPKSAVQLQPKASTMAAKVEKKASNKNNNADKPKSPKSPKLSARSRGSSRGSKR